jgi:hypothetical protein
LIAFSMKLRISSFVIVRLRPGKVPVS